MNDKISAKHLERAAYVYIRQSSLQQVRHNLESSRRQYALQERARELGFEQVVVIDDDLGISGAGHHALPRCARCSYGIIRKTLPFRLRVLERVRRERCGGCPIISICYECSKIQPTLALSPMAGLDANRWL